MQLTFEAPQIVGAGSNPQAIHSADNFVQIIYVGTGGSIYAREAPTPMGGWANRTFSAEHKICKDIDVEYMELKHIASSIFVVWKNAADEGEVVPYVPNTVHTLRHRFAVWSVRQDFTKFLVDGSLEFSMDDPITRLSLSFENPGYYMSHEEETALTPGTSISLYFRAGDSSRYVMGKHFIDKNDMGVTDATTSVECRNAIGKLLGDQRFDQDNTYPLQNLQTLATDIFEKASVKDYWVGTTALQRGMQFPPDMSILDGIKELLQTNLSWILQENLAGQIGFGEKGDVRFGVPSTYAFERGTDIFSRSVARDDQDAYARVCVHNETYSVAEYREIDFQFVMGSKKTLHVNVARETTSEDAAMYADQLAVLLGSTGIIETFTGPFRPYLLVGDTAKILGLRSPKVLGLITTITHKFGKSGFTTDFVVDSGMVANRTKVSDYINKITGAQTGGQATRLY